MSVLQTQSTFRGLRNLDAVLVVSVTLLCIAAPLVPPNAAIGAATGIAMLAMLAWYKRCRAATPFPILLHNLLWPYFLWPALLPTHLRPWAALLRGDCARYPLASGIS